MTHTCTTAWRHLNAAEAPVGVGFLTAPQVIVICAHVIEQAAGF